MKAVEIYRYYSSLADRTENGNCDYYYSQAYFKRKNCNEDSSSGLRVLVHENFSVISRDGCAGYRTPGAKVGDLSV